MPNTDHSTEHEQGGERSQGARRPFQPKANPQPDDSVPVKIPRALLDELIAERDRIDAPTDSLGRKRPQISKDAFAESLIRHGLAVVANVPDWSDPLALVAGGRRG